MMVFEAKDRGQAFMQEFQLALIGNDPAHWIKRLYPEWFHSEERIETEEELDAALEAEEGGVWTFERPMDPREADAALRQVLGQGGGTLNAEELPEMEGDWDG